MASLCNVAAGHLSTIKKEEEHYYDMSSSDCLVLLLILEHCRHLNIFKQDLKNVLPSASDRHSESFHELWEFGN